MPSTPTTKSQVQAYRFVLRRMESALVRKDPVMLHDPMRSHKRSTVVGVILGVVGLVAFLVVGLFTQSAAVPSSGIVIAKNAGTIYVVSQTPRELIPVFNLASARLLLLAAQQQQQQQQSGGSSSSQSQTQSAANATVVDDTALKGIPMGRLTGIPDGPTVLPAPAPATQWAVCDTLPRDVNANAANVVVGAPTTTVLVGQQNIGTNLTANQALLVSADGGRTDYLVYALTNDVNHPDDSAVRALVDQSAPVLSALSLSGVKPRQISPALLSAIPQVADIQNPAKNLDRTQPAAPALAGVGLSIGDSFQVQDVGSTSSRFFMVVPGGMQQVSRTVAQIARSENSNGQTDIKQVAPDTINSVSLVPNGLQVNVADYPGQVPVVIDPGTKQVTCLGWSADFSDKAKPIARTRVAVDTQLNLPTDSSGQAMTSVAIGQGTSTGRINSFFMTPSLGGVVFRPASGAREFGKGPIEVVDPRGQRFSVPDLPTAQALGVASGAPDGGIAPAPESIVSLLPLSNATLSTQAVQRTFDSIPLSQGAGQFIEPTTPGSGG